MAIRQLTSRKFQVDILDYTGKRIRKNFNQKAEAKAFENNINKLKYDMKLGLIGLSKRRYLLLDALDEFEQTKIQLRPSSIKKYGNVFSQLRLFIEAIGIKYIDQFSPDVASLFYNEITREKTDLKGNTDKVFRAKPKTVNFYLMTLRSFLQHEVIKGHLEKNPAVHLKNMKVEKRPPEYYTREELKLLFEQEMPDNYRDVFTAFLNTGVRFQELSSLTWGDVDLTKRLIHVRKKDGFNPKSDNSERAIPMNKTIYDLLIKLKRKNGSAQYPFCSSIGTQLSERRTLRILKRVAENAGIKSNCFIHKFRHTFATHLIQKGVPIQEISVLLGHSSIKETEIYAHNDSTKLHNKVKLLDDLI